MGFTIDKFEKPCLKLHIRGSFFASGTEKVPEPDLCTARDPEAMTLRNSFYPPCSDQWMQCSAKSLQLYPTLYSPMNCTCQAPLSMGFSRQEYWSGLPYPPPGDLPNPGIKPVSLISCISRSANRTVEWVPMPYSRGSSQPRDQTCVSCIAGGFFTAEPSRKPLNLTPNLRSAIDLWTGWFIWAA